MLTQIGNTLKLIAFSLLCAAILEKIEFMVAISIILYSLGTMLVNVGIEKIQSDVEEKNDD